MNRKEFLEELEERLIGVSKEDKKEILQDYEEHFKIGKKKKRTEEEISKSLGEPKEIAREIRRELSGREKDELKTESIETWVALKKFSKHLFSEISERVDTLYDNFDSKKISHWFWLGLAIIFLSIIIGAISGSLLFVLIIIALIIIGEKATRKKSPSKSKDKSKSKKSFEGNSLLKTILILIFNILLFVWIWLGLFILVMGLFIGGFALIISGILLVIFSIFSLVEYSNYLLKDLFFSALFAGAGITILGILFTNLFDEAIKLFFKLTKKYLELNRELIKK